MLVNTTQEHQIKCEKKLNNFPDLLNFLVGKFKKYEEDCTKNGKIIENVKIEFQCLSKWKSSKRQQANSNIPETATDARKATSEILLETLNNHL